MVAYPAEDLLRKVRFISRFYAEGDQLEEKKPLPGDVVAQFIAKIEKSDSAFQRKVSKVKVEGIKRFYEMVSSQPPIPATVLLFTPEVLRFEPLAQTPSMGNLYEPKEPFLIIDGQHRLAALHFYIKDHPHDAGDLYVPTIIFDGKSHDFATEMFVIINSTPTRINKSHLIDLYERISWNTPEKKLAALVTQHMYEEPDSPLRYRINRLGGRSGQKKWILQAELYNEILRWIEKAQLVQYYPQVHSGAHHLYEHLRDFFKASRAVWEEAWDNEKYMVCTSVSLKAMVRVFSEFFAKVRNAYPTDRVRTWTSMLQGWSQLKRDFRKEGFYERFVAKGQVERIKTIQNRLMETVGEPTVFD